MNNRLVEAALCLLLAASFNCEIVRAHSTDGRTQDSGKDKDAKDSVVERLLVVYRQSPDTDSIKPAVEHALCVLPAKVTKAMLSAGIKVRIVPTLLDYDATLSWPFGMPPLKEEDSVVDDNFGIFHVETKSVLIAEKGALGQGGKLERNPSAFRTTLHECGHAFDFCSGDLSRGEEFRLVCQSERAGHWCFGSVPPNQKDVWESREVFAGCVMDQSLKLVGEPEERGNLLELNPRCEQLVQRMIR